MPLVSHPTNTKLCGHLRRLTAHELRHTFATIALVELRIPVNVVSEWLGHANASTTIDTYGHSLTEIAVSYADLLGATFGRTAETG